jgi:hypothetical protein
MEWALIDDRATFWEGTTEQLSKNPKQRRRAGYITQISAKPSAQCALRQSIR